MKTVKLLSRLSLIVLLSISTLNSVTGQKKINLTAGIGMPELLNIGIRGQLVQTVFGISVGTVPILEEKSDKIVSVCGDLFIHLGKVSEISKRRVWYVRTGFNYLSDKSIVPDREDRYTYLNLRLGRDLNISKKCGIQIDVGLLRRLSQKRIPEPVWLPGSMMTHGGTWRQGDMMPTDGSVLPSIGLNFFFQL